MLFVDLYAKGVHMCSALYVSIYNRCIHKLYLLVFTEISAKSIGTQHLHNRRSRLFLSCKPLSQVHQLCRLDVSYRSKYLRDRGGYITKNNVNNASVIVIINIGHHIFQ